MQKFNDEGRPCLYIVLMYAFIQLKLNIRINRFTVYDLFVTFDHIPNTSQD